MPVHQSKNDQHAAEPAWLAELRGHPSAEPVADGVPGEPAWLLFAELIAKLQRMKRLQMMVVTANVVIFVVQIVQLLASWQIIQILRPGWLPWQ